ncbi:hypothetical protein [Nonomuraea rubra]|uniref:hypothetical protein n=1 Tax=Nonomuraea rubra TaxID=46180 RepID=UPI0033ECA21A
MTGEYAYRFEDVRRFDPAANATTPSLEASALPPAVRLPAKSLVAGLSVVAPTLPGKVEGLALLDRGTLAVANDNDFGVAGFGADGRVVGSGVPSRIVTIRLPRPLR